LAGDAGSDDQGRTRALIALGADVADDFCDGDLARRALDAADFVVVVAGHPSATTDRADVVLPAAVAHERAGTTTNVEGRVSRLGQKLVPPGHAWPDWMIAAGLAEELGADLGLGSLAEVWEEIERLAPAYAGVTTTVLDGEEGRDGVVVPPDASAPAGRVPDPIDPMALPGVESVERQGAPPRVGQAELPAIDESRRKTPAQGPDRPPLLSVPPAAEALHVPSVDSYSLRLVSSRHLYDAGRAVSTSPSLAPQVGWTVVRANPHDLDRLGVGTGDSVRVRSARGDLVLPVESDAAVPRGVVDVGFNLPAAGDASEGATANAAAALIDAGAAVNEVRLESVG
jgi:NADH-quinone oxidoreductase subunit G